MYLLNLIIILISVSSGFANIDGLAKFFQLGSNQLMGTVKAEGYNAIQELNSLSSNNKITSHLNRNILNANKKIERFPRSLLKSELKEETVILDNVSACKNNYSAESDKLINTSKNDNQICLNTAQNDIRTINRQLKSYTDDLTKEIQNLSQVNNKCYRFLRPISSSSCISQEIRSIQRSIQSILNNGRTITIENDNKFKDILDKNAKCININVKSFKNEMEVIVRKIVQCILKDELTTLKDTVTTKKLTVPTIIPTTIPTPIPTIIPPTIPTIAPTTIPPTVPTTIPTTNPTTNPPTAPTTIPTTTT